jgi:hypothetical protein
MAEVLDKEPFITKTELDEDVASLSMSLEQYYRDSKESVGELPQELDEMITTVFADAEKSGLRLAASDLIRKLERELPASVFQWTGHMPERTRWLLDAMAERADALAITYRLDQGEALTVSLTSLVTALAMNWLQSGKYVP